MNENKNKKFKQTKYINDDYQFIIECKKKEIIHIHF